MQNQTESALAVRSTQNAHALVSSRAIPERGRRLILWGWISTMIGVVAYCRALFAMSPNTNAIDALIHSGVIGWVASFLTVIGVSMWLMGNLIYLRDLMDSPAPVESSDQPQGQGMPGKAPQL